MDPRVNESTTEDNRRQSILKMRPRFPLQEVPSLQEMAFDDDTTSTITRNRRVSFGRNLVKEFIVGSAASMQAIDIYEQSSESCSDRSSGENSGPLDLALNKSCHESYGDFESSSVTLPSNERVRHFTENCITLAKSVFDKRETELTAIIIGAKTSNGHEEGKNTLSFTPLDVSTVSEKDFSLRPQVDFFPMKHAEMSTNRSQSFDKSKFEFLDRTLDMMTNSQSNQKPTIEERSANNSQSTISDALIRRELSAKNTFIENFGLAKDADNTLTELPDESLLQDDMEEDNSSSLEGSFSNLKAQLANLKDRHSVFVEQINEPTRSQNTTILSDISHALCTTPLKSQYNSAYSATNLKGINATVNMPCDMTQSFVTTPVKVMTIAPKTLLRRDTTAEYDSMEFTVPNALRFKESSTKENDDSLLGLRRSPDDEPDMTLCVTPVKIISATPHYNEKINEPNTTKFQEAYEMECTLNNVLGRSKYEYPVDFTTMDDSIAVPLPPSPCKDQTSDNCNVEGDSSINIPHVAASANDSDMDFTENNFQNILNIKSIIGASSAEDISFLATATTPLKGNATINYYDTKEDKNEMSLSESPDYLKCSTTETKGSNGPAEEQLHHVTKTLNSEERHSNECMELETVTDKVPTDGNLFLMDYATCQVGLPDSVENNTLPAMSQNLSLCKKPSLFADESYLRSSSLNDMSENEDETEDKENLPPKHAPNPPTIQKLDGQNVSKFSFLSSFLVQDTDVCSPEVIISNTSPDSVDRIQAGYSVDAGNGCEIDGLTPLENSRIITEEEMLIASFNKKEDGNAVVSSVCEVLSTSSHKMDVSSNEADAISFLDISKRFLPELAKKASDSAFIIDEAIASPQEEELFTNTKIMLHEWESTNVTTSKSFAVETEETLAAKPTGLPKNSLETKSVNTEELCSIPVNAKSDINMITKFNNLVLVSNPDVAISAQEYVQSELVSQFATSVLVSTVANDPEQNISLFNPKLNVCGSVTISELVSKAENDLLFNGEKKSTSDVKDNSSSKTQPLLDKSESQEIVEPAINDVLNEMSLCEKNQLTESYEPMEKTENKIIPVIYDSVQNSSHSKESVSKEIGNNLIDGDKASCGNNDPPHSEHTNTLNRRSLSMIEVEHEIASFAEVSNPNISRCEEGIESVAGFNLNELEAPLSGKTPMKDVAQMVICDQSYNTVAGDQSITMPVIDGRQNIVACQQTIEKDVGGIGEQMHEGEIISSDRIELKQYIHEKTCNENDHSLTDGDILQNISSCEQIIQVDIGNMNKESPEIQNLNQTTNLDTIGENRHLTRQDMPRVEHINLPMADDAWKSVSACEQIIETETYDNLHEKESVFSEEKDRTVSNKILNECDLSVTVEHELATIQNHENIIIGLAEPNNDFSPTGDHTYVAINKHPSEFNNCGNNITTELNSSPFKEVCNFNNVSSTNITSDDTSPCDDFNNQDRLATPTTFLPKCQSSFYVNVNEIPDDDADDFNDVDPLSTSNAELEVSKFPLEATLPFGENTFMKNLSECNQDSFSTPVRDLKRLHSNSPMVLLPDQKKARRSISPKPYENQQNVHLGQSQNNANKDITTNSSSHDGDKVGQCESQIYSTPVREVSGKRLHSESPFNLSHIEKKTRQSVTPKSKDCSWKLTMGISDVSSKDADAMLEKPLLEMDRPDSSSQRIDEQFSVIKYNDDVERLSGQTISTSQIGTDSGTCHIEVPSDHSDNDEHLSSCMANVSINESNPSAMVSKMSYIADNGSKVDKERSSRKKIIQERTDKKVYDLLRDWSCESNCLWRLEAFQECLENCPGYFSISFPLLDDRLNLTINVSNEKEYEISSIEINIIKGNGRKSNCSKRKSVNQFGFDIFKKYILDEEKVGKLKISDLPFAMDASNAFCRRLLSLMEQILTVLKGYAGSRFSNNVLRYRLYSFPTLMSCYVEINVSPVLHCEKPHLTFCHDMGSLEEDAINNVLEKSWTGLTPLITFVKASVQYIISEEKKINFVTKRPQLLF